MIGSLVRLLGLGDTPRAASAPRFAPLLEVLDGRTMPSVVGGVDVGGAGDVSLQEQVSLNGTGENGETLPSPLSKATPILFNAHTGEALPELRGATSDVEPLFRTTGDELREIF